MGKTLKTIDSELSWLEAFEEEFGYSAEDLESFCPHQPPCGGCPACIREQFPDFYDAGNS